MDSLLFPFNFSNPPPSSFSSLFLLHRAERSSNSRMDIDSDDNSTDPFSIIQPFAEFLRLNGTKLEQLLSLSIRSLGVDPDSSIPEWMTRRGVHSEYRHLSRQTNRPFDHHQFKEEFDPIKDRYHLKGLEGNEYLLTLTLCNDSAVELVNRFVFLVECPGVHQKTQCAILLPDDKLGWILDFRTQFPKSFFCPFKLSEIIYTNPPKKRTINGREIVVQIETRGVGIQERCVLDIWKEYSRINPSIIKKIVFDPKLLPGLQPDRLIHQIPNSFLFNEWRGLPHPKFGTDRESGRIRMEIIDRDEFGVCDTNLAIFLFHVYAVICNFDLVAANYLLDLIAYRRMFPWEPIPVMVCITGEEQGTGKSMFISIITALLGDHAIFFQNPRALCGAFNGALSNRIFVGIDEVEIAKESENAVKSLLTNTHVDVNEKFEKLRHEMNRIFLMISSNSNTDCIPSGILPRRVFWTEVNRLARELPSNYWKRLVLFLTHPDLLFQLDFYFHLRAQRRGFEDFMPKNRPLTQALRNAILHSLEGPVKWLYSVALAKDILFGIANHSPINLVIHWREDTRWPRPDEEMDLRVLFKVYQNWHLQSEHKSISPFEDKSFYEKICRTLHLEYNPDQPFIPIPPPQEIQNNLVDFNKDYSIQ